MVRVMVESFSHKVGFHCESSAMRDLFEFYEFPMSEAMAFGLDATMGFGFFDKTNKLSTLDGVVNEIPFFVGGKQGTIEPNSLACRLLGIKLRKQSFSSADKAWQESKILLNNNIPLILKVDIGYLPFYEHEQEIHFGGHAITLGGYNEEKGVAYVGDTEFEGFQEVPIETLKEGRSSKEGDSFMFPENTQFSMERRPDGKHPPLAAGVKLAIQEVVNNMLRPSINNIGIQGLNLFANSISKWRETLKGSIKNPYSGKIISLARLMFELTHGYIETWGTGGSAFRKLYKEFLEELIEHPELKEGPRAWNKEEFKILEESLPLINNSALNWTLIADTLKNAADKYESECLNHVDFNELGNTALYILSNEKELFKNLSKIKL